MIRVGLGLGTTWLGNVNYYRNLIAAVMSLEDRKVEPVLLATRAIDDRILQGFPSTEIVRSPWLDDGTPRWLLRKLWQQSFACDPFLQGVARSNRIDVLSHSDFLGSRAVVPTVCWIGDLQHRQLPQFFKWHQRLYRDRDFHLQCRYATRIAVSSFDSQRMLADFDPRSVGKSRVLQFVVQPMAHGEATEQATLRSRYGVDGPYFHVPNQFWVHKNHVLILEAMAILRDRGQSALVVSTGATEDCRDPQHFSRVMSRAAELGISDSFRVLGVIPYPDVVGLMVNSVSIINPSRAEGWSTAVEEAKSLGKRVILSDLAVHREQAPARGVYFDVDDAGALAEAMNGAMSSWDEVEERQWASRAETELPGRVAEFGEAFQRIVLEASEDRAG
jgi:glycosyltransferase involved in cell wall biosynthesis